MFKSNLDKKAWLRIVEAFIGIIMITGVVLTLMSRPAVTDVSVQQETIKLEKFILDRVVADPVLRNQILVEEYSGVNAVLASSVPAGISWVVKICDYDKVCALGATVPYDVYSEEYLVSSNLTYYDPVHVKVIKLFFWHGEPIKDYCSSSCGGLNVGDVDKSCFGTKLAIHKTCTENSSNCFFMNETSREDCSLSGKVCENGECVVAAPIFADLRLSLAMFIPAYQSGTRYYYNHTRIFTEYNGVGVNITSYNVCYLDGTCDFSSPSSTISYNITARGTLTLNRLSGTNIVPDKFIYKYYGKDNTGKNVEINASLCVNGLTVTPNC